MKTLNIKLAKTSSIVRRPDSLVGPNRSSRGVGSFSTGFSYSGFYDDKFIYAVHLEKRRGKSVNKTGASGTKRQPTHWVKTVTYFPIELLKHLPKGSKFVQHKHHWELTSTF